MADDTKVCVVGIWHQGAVASACLADLGYTVIGVDSDPIRVENLNRGKAPLFEPGLDTLLEKNINENHLFFTTNMSQALRDAHYVLFTFDTAVDEEDNVDLSEILSAVGTMAKFLEPGATLLVTAQVPVGTCDQVKQVIRKSNPGADFGIVYSPENLRLGQAIERFKKPDMMVIGSDNKASLDDVEEFLKVIPCPKIRTNLRTAEMSKHVLNAFLATSISFANEVANLCDEVGADALTIAKILRMDSRVSGNAPLLPGLAFSGGTLARDMKVLQNLGDRVGYDTHLIDGALEVNEMQKGLVVRRLRKVYGSLSQISVGMLGLTYKPDTSTLRRSVSIEIIQDLIANGATVKAWDPKADREELKQHPEFETCSDAYQVACGADALVFVTAWPEFKELDFARIKATMNRPLVIDTQNIFDATLLIGQGFTYYGVGRGGIAEGGM
jgi:UDPglucose 6-dehydrogenase